MSEYRIPGQTTARRRHTVTLKRQFNDAMLFFTSEQIRLRNSPRRKASSPLFVCSYFFISSRMSTSGSFNKDSHQPSSCSASSVLYYTNVGISGLSKGWGRTLSESPTSCWVPTGNLGLRGRCRWLGWMIYRLSLHRKTMFQTVFDMGSFYPRTYRRDCTVKRVLLST